jgi:prophage antirepressor-like protein
MNKRAKIEQDFRNLLEIIELQRPGYIAAIGEGVSDEIIRDCIKISSIPEGLMVIYSQVRGLSASVMYFGDSNYPIDLIPGGRLIDIYELNELINSLKRSHEEYPTSPIWELYPEAERKSYNKYLEKIEGRWLHQKKILMKVGNKDAVRTLGTIYEPGLYQLIATSGSPLASEFKRWVFEEVLPSIRKTGSYTAPGIDASCLKSELLPNSTITDIDSFAQFAAGKIAETNLPQSIKNLYLVRALREAFPQNKEFDILTQALSSHDLQAHQDKITFRTYHSTAGLAEVYGSKHKLSEPIDRRIIHQALIEKNLLKKGEHKSEYLPTELGKHYCIVGWHHNDDESLIPEVQWRQEVLNVLGSLH